ncbi:MAG TPA: gephyrin-like molybdotransferase Glp [Rhizomicrobium sp.]
MISVDEAVARIAAALSPVPPETVPIADAIGRTLEADAVARLDQPPHSVSAMDGYAVRAIDVAQAPVTLDVIGAAPAGHPIRDRVGPGQTVRIFTGGVVPEGADTIVIQENTDLGAAQVQILRASEPGRHIRRAGLDFAKGDVLVRSGKQLTARDVALIAAGDVPELQVRKKPRILLAATGDELSKPGESRKPGGIVASSVYGLAGLIERWGGETRNLGILPDRADAIAQIAERAVDADLIVTLGGASVGEHDLVQRALGPEGFVLDFWKIAMRPGKPLIFGRLGTTPLLGLPGNPVSSYVCALVFLKPAMAALLGISIVPETFDVRLAAALPENDRRQDYLRARIVRREGELWAEPFPLQDSSMQKVLAEADALIVRAPHAAAANTGDMAFALPLE